MTEAVRTQGGPPTAGRVDVQLAANGRILPVDWIRDLCPTGVLLGCEEPLPLGTPCQLTLCFATGVQHRILVLGHVVRQDAGCIALQLKDINASASFSSICAGLAGQGPSFAGATGESVDARASAAVRKVS